MRTHSCRMLLLATAMIVMTPKSSDAGLLSWLSRLSGPGPFWGMDLSVAVKCFKVNDPDPQPTTQATKPGMMGGITLPCRGVKLDDRHWELYVTVGGAVAENNPLDYGDSGRQAESTAVRFLKLGAAFDYTAWPALDVGFGAGLLYFAGPRFDNFVRLYVEPARATIRPLVVGVSDPDRRERRGWLLISASWTVLLGEITGETFGAPRDLLLDERNESVLGLSASVDLLRLLKNFRGSR